MFCLAQQNKGENFEEFYAQFLKDKEYINSSRPTAVNLSWAVNRIDKMVVANKDKSVEEIVELIGEEAIAIQKEDIAMCKAISEFGLSLLKEGDGVLTHCNAGPLATSRYGTAIGPMLMAQEKGINVKVFSDETRPLLQGARLTSYELHKAGVDVTLICDNMASMVMKNGWVQACFVGCDRVAANGDAANKIGTSGVAILAKHYGIPFYVLGPTSTIDMNCKTGDDIVIELRDEDEIRSKFYEQPMALADVKCFNPAFDVTDHELIAGIITEKGIMRPPYTESLAKLFE
jgi:methylthioribose-1-phosphate isomerase